MLIKKERVMWPVSSLALAELAALSFGSPLLVHISNWSRLACLLGNCFLLLASPSHFLHLALSMSSFFLKPFACPQAASCSCLSCQKAGLGLLCSHIQVGQFGCWMTTSLSLSAQELNEGTHFVLCAASHSHKT